MASHRPVRFCITLLHMRLQRVMSVCVLRQAMLWFPQGWADTAAGFRVR